MNEQSNAILAYWSEHREQLRQSETQRSVLTNFILVIVAALTGLVVQQGLGSTTLPVAGVIAVLGLYGALTSAKYHERATYHLTQARAFTVTLVQIGTLPINDDIDQYRHAHYRTYPFLHRIRLHWLWTGLHLAIAMYGAALAAIILLR